ncbi:hypothetical protein V6248_05300 [Pseudoalteromonas agarivorans]|uniref:hypothetical protein n=1 Tax=Pseudoalteromonas agarivorans TaxID=176102 RepID=UPI00311FFFD1
MSWMKVKVFILIVIIILISEVIRLYTGIPVTIMDIIIFPITCLLVYFMRFYTSPFSDLNADKYAPPPLSALQLFGFVLFSIILVIAGVWIAWMGILAPLEYFSSVKGGGHGYSLIQLGVITTIYSLWFGLKFSHRLIQLHFTSA